MTNIVLIARDRPRLTEQCLRTLYENTNKDTFNLTIVDDGSDGPASDVIQEYGEGHDNCEVLTLLYPIGIVGFLRNIGTWASERFFGRGDYLYESDNDLVFLPKWLTIMENRMLHAETFNIPLLGGYRHPFHSPIGEIARTKLDETIEITDAVAGYSHMMTWQTWDLYGPYDQQARGVCQSEDFAFCQRIVKAGGRVGYVNPPVIANCGITNSEGRPAIGAEHFPRHKDLIYE